MRKIWWIAGAILIPVLPSASLADAEPASPHSSGNAVVLQRVQDILQKVHSTRYSHRTEIDEQHGVYNVDCSGLARYVLRQTAPQALRVLPHETSFSYPRAVSFYSGFTNIDSPAITSYWNPIRKFSDVEAGDFIAWRKIEIKKGDNSGHVLIALEKPTCESDGSYRVKLVDSSAGKHTDDSRSKGQSGIGTGVMWFEVNEHEEPVGFRWTRQSRVRRCPISIGRVLTTGTPLR